MIKIIEKIQINSDQQKVWSFLSELDYSLSFHRFHSKIILPQKFSVNSNDIFKIISNYGFDDFETIAQVTECIVPKLLSISKRPDNELGKGFKHKICFEIIAQVRGVELLYTTSGTFGNIVQDISFRPILKGVVKEELIKIKNAIESSEKSFSGLQTNSAIPS